MYSLTVCANPPRVMPRHTAGRPWLSGRLASVLEALKTAGRMRSRFRMLTMPLHSGCDTGKDAAGRRPDDRALHTHSTVVSHVLEHVSYPGLQLCQVTR